MSARMPQRHLKFLFLNLGHFLDHLVMLVFASVAALRLNQEWGMSYAELVPYATPGFIAFGAGAIVAGWLADKWSREGMIVIFFIGIGASAIIAGFADTPLQLAVALTVIGVFAAIYHPVGIAMVIEGRKKTGVALAINGVFGNLGVASAALLTGLLIDTSGWRSAFQVPGAIALVLGLAYYLITRDGTGDLPSSSLGKRRTAASPVHSKQTLILVFGIIFFTTALGGLIFQSTTFALPKIFDERLGGLAVSATEVGWYAFLVFALAALAQLVVGYLIDRKAIKPIFVVVAFCQMLLFAVMSQLSGVLALLVSFGFMFVVFGQIPINDVLVGRMAKSEWRSRALAVRYIITFSVMASTLPLIGWLHYRWGFDLLFILLSVTAGLIFVATLFLPSQAIES